MSYPNNIWATPTERMVWVKSLKIGDVVCDCKFKHQKIIDLNEESVVIYPLWLYNIIFSDLMPDWVGNFSDKVCRFFNLTRLTDKNLVLEDGNYCSAIHCCNKPDHFSSHPNAEIYEYEVEE